MASPTEAGLPDPRPGRWLRLSPSPALPPALVQRIPVTRSPVLGFCPGWLLVIAAGQVLQCRVAGPNPRPATVQEVVVAAVVVVEIRPEGPAGRAWSAQIVFGLDVADRVVARVTAPAGGRFETGHVLEAARRISLPSRLETFPTVEEFRATRSEWIDAGLHVELTASPTKTPTGALVATGSVLIAGGSLVSLSLHGAAIAACLGPTLTLGVGAFALGVVAQSRWWGDRTRARLALTPGSSWMRPLRSESPLPEPGADTDGGSAPPTHAPSSIDSDRPQAQ